MPLREGARRRCGRRPARFRIYGRAQAHATDASPRSRNARTSCRRRCSPLGVRCGSRHVLATCPRSTRRRRSLPRRAARRARARGAGPRPLPPPRLRQPSTSSVRTRCSTRSADAARGPAPRESREALRAERSFGPPALAAQQRPVPSWATCRLQRARRRRDPDDIPSRRGRRRFRRARAAIEREGGTRERGRACGLGRRPRLAARSQTPSWQATSTDSSRCTRRRAARRCPAPPLETRAAGSATSSASHVSGPEQAYASSPERARTASHGSRCWSRSEARAPGLATGLLVLTVEGETIAASTRFGDGIQAAFGLPPCLAD